MHRLEDPAAIYRALSVLQIGDVVPVQLYISDYEDGEIPRWVLIWREEMPATEQLALIFEDQTPYARQGDMFDPYAHLLPRKGVLTWARKTLATREYRCEEVAWRCPEQKMCDLGQQARLENRRQAREKGAA